MGYDAVSLFKLEGRRSTGYYNALKSMIPVLSSLFGGSTFMLIGFMLMFVLVMCLAGAFAAMFFGGFSIARNSIQVVSSAVKSFVLPKQQKKTCQKQMNHQACYQQFRRRHLPYCLMQRCRTRQFDLALLGPHVRQHWHWRRRMTKYKVKYKVKCSHRCLTKFLTPL